MLPVSGSIGHEGFFDGAKVIYFVCVVVYFDLEKNLVFHGYDLKSVRVCFIWGRNEYYVCPSRGHLTTTTTTTTTTKTLVNVGST